MLLTFDNVNFGYVDNSILNNISFALNEGDRVGLVGVNGSGKTTLLKIIMGELAPDGSVSKKSGMEIGYLEQNALICSHLSVIEEMRSVFKGCIDAEKRIREIELKLSDDSDKKLLRELDALHDYLNAKDGYAIESNIKIVLGGMGFLGREDEIIDTLSSGERTRLALCKLLLSRPDLLLLDEPTNHLDFKTMNWLQKFLSSYRGAIIIVSHDRYFLDKTVTRIFDLENANLTEYKGNYTKYKLLKREYLDRRQKEYERQQERIFKLEDYAARNIVRASTSNMAKSRLNTLSRMERIDKPFELREQKFEFSSKYPMTAKKVLTVRDLSVGYPPLAPLASDINLEVINGDRVAILGENGCGKSTLVKRVMQAVNYPDKNVFFGNEALVSYFDQNSAFNSEKNTVLEEIWYRYNLLPQSVVRGALAKFSLADDVEKRVEELSGGEKARLKLAIMYLFGGNVLVLDEPTNHLDLSGKEALEEALEKFSGTVIFVSHDRYFISRLANKLLVFEDGVKTEVYPMSYEKYLSILEERENEAASEKALALAKAQKSSPQKYNTAKDRSEKVRIKNLITETEKRIEEAENRINEINGEIACITDFDYKKIQALTEEQKALTAECDALYAKLEELI